MCRHKAERRQNHASLSAMNLSNIEDYEKVHSRGDKQWWTAKQSTIRMSTAMGGNDPVFTPALNEFLSHDSLKSYVKGRAVRDKRLAHKCPLRNSCRHTRHHKHDSLTYPRLKQGWKKPARTTILQWIRLQCLSCHQFQPPRGRCKKGGSTA